MVDEAAKAAPLDVIEYHESRGKNVPNYRYDKTHTAGGYWQITDSTWRAAAPKAGVDTAKFPNALSAPREVQKVVANQLYSDHGYAPWAPFNPALAKAVGWKGPIYDYSAETGKIASRKLPTAGMPAGARALTADDDPTRRPSRLTRAVSSPADAPGVPISLAQPAAAPAVAAPAPLQLQPISPIQPPNLRSGYADALGSIMAGRRRPLASMFG